jgi:hypothetical protein
VAMANRRIPQVDARPNVRESSTGVPISRYSRPERDRTPHNSPGAKMTRLFFELNTYDLHRRSADEGRVSLDEGRTFATLPGLPLPSRAYATTRSALARSSRRRRSHQGTHCGNCLTQESLSSPELWVRRQPSDAGCDGGAQGQTAPAEDVRRGSSEDFGRSEGSMGKAEGEEVSRTGRRVRNEREPGTFAEHSRGTAKIALTLQF